MKFLRYVLAIMTMCALGVTVQAHAFKLGVLDAGPGFDYTGTPLTNLLFSPCSTGSLDGCITIENETGAVLTGFQLEFSNTGLTTQGACGVTGSFSSCTESMGGGNYFFTFSGGTGVPFDANAGNENEESAESWDTDDLTDTFTIQVTGEPYTDFGPLTLTATPEPSSIWLLSTGGLLLGAFFYYKRRKGLGELGL